MQPDINGTAAPATVMSIAAAQTPLRQVGGIHHKTPAVPRPVVIEKWEQFKEWSNDRTGPFWLARLAEHPGLYLGDRGFVSPLPERATRFPGHDLALDVARAALGAMGPALPEGAEAAAPPESPAPAPARPGLAWEATFCPDGTDPYATVEWVERPAAIPGSGFRQERVRVPAGWGDLDLNVAASKYLYGDPAKGDDPRAGGREQGIDQLVDRVCGTIADWGRDDGTFASDADVRRFRADLTWLCLHQHAAFNSPVWFNVGLHDRYGIAGRSSNWRWDAARAEAVPAADAYKYPQGSACFIQSVDDSMESIMALATSEAMLFKFGSGTGTDLSPLRSRREKLAGGGRPSGPVSFLRIYDAVAREIKSGGVSRRAAKMNTLRCDHPDVADFIDCKRKEEDKMRALLAAGAATPGMTGDPDEAYSSVAFQNVNLSVRATDDFMRRATDPSLALAERSIPARGVTTDEPLGTLDPAALLDRVAENTHHCGDPGLQFSDTINSWHTCPNTAPIASSNPCSEFVFINDSACNLASINLLKFLRPDGTFDAERFLAAVRTLIVAQEILVDHCSYPTERIARNSHDFRPLGLGYANLGALLMVLGLPYDSDAGRDLAAAITALMTAGAYVQSARLAATRGAFAGFAANREPMLRVIGRHAAASWDLLAATAVGSEPDSLARMARDLWVEARSLGEAHGYRNAQVTLLAPTGTIAFLMGCDTTGIEPAMLPVQYKSLAGGGTLVIPLRCLERGLARLGYDDPAIAAHARAHGTLEGCPGFRAEDLSVFDCAFPARPGGRTIPWRGHVAMLAAVQPFLSGSISKTINLPADATVADIRAAYVEAWRSGLKAVAIFRDGSKGVQPVTATAPGAAASRPESPPAPAPAAPPPAAPHRERLPVTRRSLNHKFVVAGHEGYVNLGFYPDGRPGEIFITMTKQGSTIGGLMDALATAVSIGLQYGVPLAVFVAKFAHGRFEPAGPTGNPAIPFASSITDYVFRWLGLQLGAAPAGGDAGGGAEAPAAPGPAVEGVLCPACGGLAVRSGSCHTCTVCGNSLGCS